MTFPGARHLRVPLAACTAWLQRDKMTRCCGMCLLGPRHRTSRVSWLDGRRSQAALQRTARSWCVFPDLHIYIQLQLCHSLPLQLSHSVRCVHIAVSLPSLSFLCLFVCVSLL